MILSNADESEVKLSARYIEFHQPPPRSPFNDKFQAAVDFETPSILPFRCNVVDASAFALREFKSTRKLMHIGNLSITRNFSFVTRLIFHEKGKIKIKKKLGHFLSKSLARSVLRRVANAFRWGGTFEIRLRKKK